MEFAQEDDILEKNSLPWKILIVDDNKHVHSITKSVLKNFIFDDRALYMKSAYDSKEAYNILEKDSDYALVLLDVVMETPDAGLVLVKKIREVLHNSSTRIVLRTGEPNSAPETLVISEYDIHDYKDKTDLSDIKLITTITSALRSYRDIKKIKDNEAYLQKVVDERTRDLKLLNEELETRVKSQISYMIEQYKYAQIGETIAMIAHQWRQPLGSISAIVINNLTKYELEILNLEEVNKDLYRIQDVLQHLSSTINEFRNFFKPVKEKENCDIEELIDSSLNLVESALSFKNITVIKNYKTSPTILSFKNEIKQVFLNILNNAKDSIEFIENPTIVIDVREEDNFIKVAIEDNGKGIEIEDMDKIFEPYFSTKSKNGTGLGLYMSKMIVEDHCHGNIDIQNSDTGVIVSIFFPIDA